MKKSINYRKPQCQIRLESLLNILKKNGITTISQLELPEYAKLRKDLNYAIAETINVLVREKKLIELINSIATSYPSKYYSDRNEYDTLYEVISETFVGLYKTITKSAGDIDNTGRIRIDTYLDKEPEQFVFTLRKYIRYNICYDIARAHCREIQHIVFIDDEYNENDEDENDSFSKLDSIIYKHNNENCTDNLIESLIRKLSYEENLCSDIINAVITRFSRKPVAVYVMLSIMNESYDAMTIVSNLKEKDLNQLVHQTIHELEDNYNIDLSEYDNTIFEAANYISSFRTADDKKARGRIDRLKSLTLKDVMKLPIIIDIMKYINVNDKYFCF